MSLEETAWRTRIRPDTLRALEDDEFDEIGHEAFVRSHLQSYARFLGIDPGEVVHAFDRVHADADALSSIEELDRKARNARKPPRARWLLAAVISLALLVGAAGVGLLGGQAERPAPDADPAVAAASGVLPVPAAEARVRLRVEALQDVQVSVQADGVEIFEGELDAGDIRMFRARETLSIIASDGGALALSHNGDDLGRAGESGVIYRDRFGPDGPLGPTE